MELGKAEYSDAEDENDDGTFHKADATGPKKVKKSGSSDYNEIALRRYELLKLRYYFAIVVCDDADTGEWCVL